MHRATERSYTSRSPVPYDLEGESSLAAEPLISGSFSELHQDAQLPDNGTSSWLAWDNLRLFAWNSGIACIAVASLFSSLSALGVKLLHGRVPVSEIVIARSVLCWLATDTIGRFRHLKPLYGAPARYHLLAVRGFMGALAMNLYYEALQRLPLGDTMTLYFICPAITVMLAWLVHGEAITWLAALGCAISLVGVAFIAQPPFLFGAPSGHYSPSHWLGVALTLGSAFCKASAVVAVRGIKMNESSLTISLWFHAAAAVSAFPLMVSGYPDPAVVPAATDSALLLAIAVFSFVGQICLNRGFQLEVAAKASAVNYTQVLYAHIWGVAFLGESEHVGGIAGSLLLAGGVVVVNLPKAPTPDQDKTAAYSAGVDPRAVSFDDTRQASASLLGGRQDSGKEVEEELELAPIHV